MASTYSQSAPLKADERALFEIFHQELLDPLVDLGRFARCLARLQRLSPLGLGGVTLDGGDPDAEGAGRLGFGHASLDGIHDLLAEVYGVGFHRSMMPPSPSSSQHAVTANFSVVDLYGMMRMKGFAEGLTQGLLHRSCMYGVRGSIPTQPAV